QRAIAAAEERLRAREPQAAESEYRTALYEAWMLVGTLERIDGKLDAARDAFRSASGSAVEDRRARQALGLVELQKGAVDDPVKTLRALAARDPKDAQTRRLLAEALGASGRTAEAVKELEDARRKAPADAELAFALATQYLRAKEPDRAKALFAEVARA